MHHRRRMLRLPGSLAALGLGLGLAAAACSSPAKNVLTDAAALEAQGKLEEAAAKLEMGCALSPSAEPCPASDAKAAETWQKAAEKAMTEGRYRDAERLFHRALLTTADDAGRATIRERIAKEDLAQGLLFERAAGIGDRVAAAAVMEDLAKNETPAGTKAKAWLVKERPALLTAAVMAACGPAHEGSCTRTWALLQEAGATGPDMDKARALAEAEERRVYPLLVQAEGFLPVFLGRYRVKEQIAKCVAGMADGESATPEGDCASGFGTSPPEERYESEKNQDTLFRRTLKQIGDPAITKDYENRRAAAEQNGNHVKLPIPKPKPAPKKP